MITCHANQPSVAAIGSVATQAKSTRRIIGKRASPETAPIPNSVPQVTCVMLTGTPKREAPITRKAAAMLAVQASPSYILVMR